MGSTSVSSSWPLALALTIALTIVTIFGRRFVPEEWRRERRGLTIFILAIGALTVVLLVVAIWSVLP